MSLFNFRTFAEHVSNSDQIVVGEGLIKTYPVANLKKALGKKIKNLGIKKIQEYQTFTGIPIGLVLTVPVQTHINEIKKILDVYGYYIGIQRGESIQVKPKYPFRVNKEDLPQYAYHIASRLRIKKIFQQGLVPRDSETLFSHPGSRIYLFVSKTENDIVSLKHMLADAKNTDPNRLTVLRIDLVEPFYYIDTNFQEGTLSDDSFGIFTVQNILPSHITKIDI